VNTRVPFRQLNLNPKVDHQYDVARGGHWATVLYGPEAANGVVDIMSDQQIAQRRADALRIRDSLGLWSYTTMNARGMVASDANGSHASEGFLFSKIEVTSELFPALRWSDLFTDPIERHRLRDSILVLVNGTRRAVVPVHAFMSLRQLHLTPSRIAAFRQTAAPWAAAVYGPDAAHGVVNIITAIINETTIYDHS
jgi:outer membrane cobalamin receptor